MSASLPGFGANDEGVVGYTLYIDAEGLVAITSCDATPQQSIEGVPGRLVLPPP